MHVLLFSFLSINFAVPQCDASGREFIAHGDLYDAVKYPYLVCIYIVNSFNLSQMDLCTGSLVSSRFVLTAAHCTDNKINYQVGITNYDTYFKILPF